MLRKRYHILVPYNEEHNVDNALHCMKILPANKYVFGTDTVEYSVDLSKYELLYLRLSCTNGKIMKQTQQMS